MSSLGERIKYAREQKGYLQGELAKLIGVKSAGVISNWETDSNKPDAEKIVRLCDVLDVSASFLLDYYGKTSFELTPLEENHIKKYRKLDPTGQEHISSFLDWEVKRTEQLRQAKAPAAIIEFQSSSNENNRMVEYFRSASAGSGVFILGNEVAEQISIPNTPENQAVDFAIKVSGDSMLPDYADGDIVLVSQKAELFHGDVGIFIINNNAYIKEYGEKELISRNPDADNIQIAEYDNIVCMGKVIGKL